MFFPVIVTKKFKPFYPEHFCFLSSSITASPAHLLLRAASLEMLPSLTPVLIAAPTSNMLFFFPLRMPSPLKTPPPPSAHLTPSSEKLEVEKSVVFYMGNGLGQKNSGLHGVPP